MLRELYIFGALVPSLLVYFLVAILIFVILDQLIALFGIYRLLWHPALARFGIFLCLFSALVLSTRI